MSELTRACVHCGICLPACPTYQVLREEADSPRGRVLLIDALFEDRATPEMVKPHLDRCIGCRACETACPSGVPYGELLEEARARLGGPNRRMRFFLRHVMSRPWLLRLAVGAGRLIGKVPKRARARGWPEPPAQPRARIALHIGCVTPHLFPELAVDAAHVLTRLGYRVDVPEGQGCCGALHRHAGLPGELDRAPFDGYDTVVSAAAGCSATDGLTDVCELLLREQSFPGAKLPPTRVAYDAPCHLLHAQGIDAGPLLDRIEGVARVPLPHAEDCCGAGGMYMEMQPELARAVRARKLAAIEASGAEIVATPNPGCMLWLKRARPRVEVVHPVTLLARAYK